MDNSVENSTVLLHLTLNLIKPETGCKRTKRPVSECSSAGMSDSWRRRCSTIELQMRLSCLTGLRLLEDLVNDSRHHGKDAMAVDIPMPSLNELQITT